MNSTFLNCALQNSRLSFPCRNTYNHHTRYISQNDEKVENPYNPGCVCIALLSWSYLCYSGKVPHFGLAMALVILQVGQNIPFQCDKSFPKHFHLHESERITDAVHVLGCANRKFPWGSAGVLQGVVWLLNWDVFLNKRSINSL